MEKRKDSGTLVLRGGRLHMIGFRIVWQLSHSFTIQGTEKTSQDEGMLGGGSTKIVNCHVVIRLQCDIEKYNLLSLVFFDSTGLLVFD